MRKQDSILIFFVVLISIFVLNLFLNFPLSDDDLVYNNESEKEDFLFDLSLSDTEIPTFEWNKTWSGENNEVAYSVAMDSNGFIYIGGKTDSYGVGGMDMILIKYDSKGNQIWNLTWGGTGDDICNCLGIDSMNNIYLAGDSNSFGLTTWNIYLIKFDSSGTQLWNKTWGNSYSTIQYPEYGRAIAIDSNNDIYIGGYTKEYHADDTDMLIIKYNSDGQQLWNLTWDGGGYERIQDIAFDSSEDIIVAGQTSYWQEAWEWDEIEYCVAKFDKDGNYQWHQSWGEWNRNDHLHSINIDSEGYIYVSGGMSSTRLMKLDSVGNLVWTRTWGFGLVYQCHGMALDQSGGIYLVGMVNHVQGATGLDMYLLKYNSTGDYQWHKTFDVGIAYDLVFDNYENIFITGGRNSNIRLVKFKSFPVLEINSPTHHQIFGPIAPDFSLSVYNSEDYLSWYTINANNTRHYFEGSMGTINQTVWDTLNNGTALITFFVNDSLNQLTTKDVIIRKDNLNFPAPVLYSVRIDPMKPDNGLIYLNWSEEVDAIRYLIYRNASLSDSVFDLSVLNSTTSSSYVDRITSAGIYYYAIIAEYEDHNSSLSNCEFSEISPNISKILITSSNGWINLALNRYWCSGSGTLNDPFIIQDIIITSVSGNSIEIRDSSMYFIIRNCIFNSATGLGIRLQNVENGIILNNTICENANNGIYITDSSQYNTISFNNISNNGNFGIQLYHSSYNNITHNLITENDAGVMISGYVSHNRVINNSLINNVGFAIKIADRANYNFVTGNIIQNGASKYILLRGADTADVCIYNNIFSNYFNGILAHTSITIDQNRISGITWAEAYNYGICTGTGKSSDPFLIKDHTIDAASASYGIKVMNSRKIAFVIQNCIIYNSYKYSDSAGITLENSSNGKIIENVCSNNDFTGIRLISSDNNTLFNNVAENNDADNVWGSGFMIRSGSTNNNISANMASSNVYGVYISNSHNNSITKNIFDSNQYRGIAVWWSDYNNISDNLAINSDYGIHIYDNCKYNLIINNTLQNNDYGFYLNDDSQFNSIIANKISSNSISGLYLGDTTQSNLLYGNNISSNSLSAQDLGVNNWNNTQKGNIWDDYAGLDVNDDGIGDTPYNIAGGSNKDYLPFCWDGDNGPPIIHIVSPLNGTFYNNLAPSFSININAIDLDSAWYCLYNGSTWSENQSILEFSGSINKSTWDLYVDGLVYIIFYANDTYGNLGITNVSIYKDTTIPNVIINNPLYFDLFGINSSPEFNITIYDSHIYSYSYSLQQNLIKTDNMTIFDSLQGMKTGIISDVLWNQIENGSVKLTFYAKDKAGNIGIEQVIIEKDTFIPNISILTPIMNKLCGNNTISFEISLDDEDIHSKWYNLNGGSNISFNELQGTINQTVWEGCKNGTLTITFYAQDFAGNIGTKQVTILKDTIAPQITILRPEQNELFGNASFLFEINLIENNLNSTWYVINNGEKHFFSEMSGLVDPIDWDSLDSGYVELEFYANDTIGNLKVKTIIIYKDCDPPQITINMPKQNQYFSSNPPVFELFINEYLIDMTWYTLNRGIKYFFTGFTSTIDQDVWENFYSEAIIITFFANDSVGNISFKELTINKDISPPNTIISYIPHSELNVVNISTIFILDATDPGGSGISRIEYAINASSWFEYRTPFNLASLMGGYYQISYRSIDNGGNIEEIKMITVKLIHLHENPEMQPKIPGFNMLIINLVVGISSIILIRKVHKIKKSDEYEKK